MVTSNLAHRIEEHDEEQIIAHESPVKYCSVALSDVIARGNRLEASVFDVEAMQARALIAGGKYPQTFLGGAEGIATSYVCGRFKRIWVKTSDIPIYQPSRIHLLKNKN